MQLNMDPGSTRHMQTDAPDRAPTERAESGQATAARDGDPLESGERSEVRLPSAASGDLAGLRARQRQAVEQVGRLRSAGEEVGNLQARLVDLRPLALQADASPEGPERAMQVESIRAGIQGAMAGIAEASFERRAPVATGGSGRGLEADAGGSVARRAFLRGETALASVEAALAHTTGWLTEYEGNEVRVLEEIAGLQQRIRVEGASRAPSGSRLFDVGEASQLAREIQRQPDLAHAAQDAVPAARAFALLAG